MPSTSTTNPGTPESRLDQAWIDYVNRNTVNGKFTSERYALTISPSSLTCYSLVKCLDPNASIWAVRANKIYAQRMHQFISKKCKEDDQFLTDLLEVLGNKSSEDIGKLSLWECWDEGLSVMPWGEIFSDSSLLKQISNGSLRSGLFSIISSKSGIRSIVANRLFNAMLPNKSLEYGSDMIQYQIPLLKHLIPFFRSDMPAWQLRLASISAHAVTSSSYLTYPEITYMGEYLCSIMQIYKKSCEDKDRQLFIPKDDIDSIRKLLEMIS